MESRRLLTVLPDAYEPDNDAEHAAEIGLGADLQVHSIHEPGDVDWIRFSLTEVSRVTVETSGSEGDTKLWLFREGATEWYEAIAYDYDSGVGYFSRIEKYLEAGVYYAATMEEGQNSTIESYGITVAAESVADQMDAFEPDDTSEAARLLLPDGSPPNHSLHTPGDVDWLTFELGQASRVTLDVQGAAGQVTLRLFGPDDAGRQISYDSYGTDGSLAQIVAYVSPGVYFASVQAYYNREPMDSYNITLAVVPQADLDDDYEPDDTASLASPIPLDGTPQSRNLHQPADVDWVTFDLDVASRVILETNGLEGDTYLQLYGPNDSGRWLASDWDSGPGDFSRLVQYLEPGSYWARVSETGQNETIASYVLGATAVPLSDLDDAYEVDDSWQQATLLLPHVAPQEHSIHRPDDSDWYRIELSEPSRVVLETDGEAGSTRLELYDPGNLTWPFAYDTYSGNGDFSRLVVFIDGGTYYARVQENGRNATIEQYTIDLETTPMRELVDAYEPDDSPAEARPLVFGAGPESRNLHRYGDVDWYTFTLSAGHRVEMETDGPDADLVLKLYTSSNLSWPFASAYASGDRAAARMVVYLDPGTYYLVVEESGQNATVDEYVIDARSVPFALLTDAWENDDNPEQARAISSDGTPAEHTIHRPSDVDWHTFIIAEPSRVTLETDGPEGATRMVLFGPDDWTQQVAYDYGSGNGDFSRIFRYRLEPGRYYVQVEESGRNDAIAQYQTRVLAQPLTDFWDAFEPDAQVGPPGIPIDGTPQPRTIHEPSDEDYVQFTLSTACRVVLQTDGAVGDTELTLYGPGDWTTEIASNTWSGKGDFSRIVVSLEAGTYFARVNENGRNQLIDAYTLSVFALPLDNLQDAHEPDDTPAQARLIAGDGALHVHNFDTPDDVDWIQFEVTEESRVAVWTDGAQGDTKLWLFAEGDYDWSHYLAYDDDGGYGAFSRIVAFLEPGSYYAATMEYGQNDTLDHFTFAATTVPLSELADPWEGSGDDTSAQATVLALSTPSPPHSLHEPSDADWFRFDVAVPSTVRVTTSGARSVDDGSVYVQLFGPGTAESRIGYDYGYGPESELTATLIPGTYFVSVSEAYEDEAIEEYVLQVEASPLGDLQGVEGTLSEPGPFELGETVTVQWTAENLGPGSTAPFGGGYSSWYDELYLSLDDQLDADDDYLGYRYVSGSPLLSGKTYTQYRSVTLPSDEFWAGRSAYILVSLDADQYLGEVNESNNVLAIPLKTNAYIELQAPYDGRFVDRQTPVEFRWLALDAQPGAVVQLAIDSDTDPGNGVVQWLVQNHPVPSQRTVESATVTLEGLAPRPEPYYVWAQVDGATGQARTKSIPVLVGDRAYVSDGGTGHPIGGDSYKVFGIEAAKLAAEYRIRVRTNYRPDGGNGGDLYIATSSGATYGLVINDHTITDGSRVLAGELYAGAEFLGGTVVSSVPTFVDSYAIRIEGKSSVEIIQTTDKPWRYEILASLSADAFLVGDEGGFSVGWAMYCGNDTDRVEVPEEEERPDLVGTSLTVSATARATEIHWGDALQVNFSVANTGGESAGASQSRLVLSADAVIDASDTMLSAANIPALDPGAAHAGQIEVTLPQTPPSGFPGSGTIYVGMIADAGSAVAEQDEANNQNRGDGIDRASVEIDRLLELKIDGGLAKYQGDLKEIVFRRKLDRPHFDVEAVLAAGETVEVDVYHGTSLIHTLTARSRGSKSYDAVWDWSPWSRADEIEVGEYSAKARIVPAGSSAEESDEKPFYVIFDYTLGDGFVEAPQAYVVNGHSGRPTWTGEAWTQVDQYDEQVFEQAIQLAEYMTDVRLTASLITAHVNSHPGSGWACRHYARQVIEYLRSVGIPARFLWALGEWNDGDGLTAFSHEDEFNHAFVEVQVTGGTWVHFDATPSWGGNDEVGTGVYADWGVEFRPSQSSDGWWVGAATRIGTAGISGWENVFNRYTYSIDITDINFLTGPYDYGDEIYFEVTVTNTGDIPVATPVFLRLFDVPTLLSMGPAREIQDVQIAPSLGVGQTVRPRFRWQLPDFGPLNGFYEIIGEREVKAVAYYRAASAERSEGAIVEVETSTMPKKVPGLCLSTYQAIRVDGDLRVLDEPVSTRLDLVGGQSIQVESHALDVPALVEFQRRQDPSDAFIQGVVSVENPDSLPHHYTFLVELGWLGDAVYLPGYGLITASQSGLDQPSDGLVIYDQGHPDSVDVGQFVFSAPVVVTDIQIHRENDASATIVTLAWDTPLSSSGRKELDFYFEAEAWDGRGLDAMLADFTARVVDSDRSMVDVTLPTGLAWTVASDASVDVTFANRAHVVDSVEASIRISRLNEDADWIGTTEPKYVVLFEDTQTFEITARGSETVTWTLPVPLDTVSGDWDIEVETSDGLRAKTSAAVESALVVDVTPAMTVEQGQPFVLNAQVANRWLSRVDGVQMNLANDPCWQIMDPGTRDLGTLQAGEVASVSWQVQPVCSGQLVARITTTSTNGGQETQQMAVQSLAPAELWMGNLTRHVLARSDGVPVVLPVAFAVQNVGDLEAADVSVGLDLPPGVTATQTSWTVRKLSAGERLWFATELTVSTQEDFSIHAVVQDSTSLRTGGVFWFDVDVTSGGPIVGQLSDTPDPLTEDGLLTLVATDVQSPSGTVGGVSFFRESNGVQGLQTGSGGDQFVAAGTQEADGWTATFSAAGLTAGSYTYYAQAVDHLGKTGPAGILAASTVNEVAPRTSGPAVTVGLVTGQPNPAHSPAVRFQVDFSEPVSDFDGGDILLAGTVPTMRVETVRRLGSGFMSYEVLIGGLDAGGTVIVTVPAGVAHSQAGIPNTSSSGGDDRVTFTPWHNVANKFDVDGNSIVSPLDALLLIHHINTHPGNTLLPPLPSAPYYRLDVTGDALPRCTPLDVLRVVNEINTRSLALGEGELDPVLSAVASDQGTWADFSPWNMTAYFEPGPVELLRDNSNPSPSGVSFRQYYTAAKATEVLEGSSKTSNSPRPQPLSHGSKGVLLGPRRHTQPNESSRERAVEEVFAEWDEARLILALDIEGAHPTCFLRSSR